MAGLQDFLQAASNEAAGTVSAPVDAIAWLLRKAGVPVSTPVGGSDWMAERGLTKPVQQNAASLAGQTAGLLSPMVAAAKAPQIARGLLQAGENLAVPTERGMLAGQRGAIVYHGSPHKFDKFDSSKIGTGEGAQAYGHGLYLAESPAVAESYQKALASEVRVGGKTIMRNGRKVATTGDSAIDDHIIGHMGDIDKAIAEAVQYGDPELPRLLELKRTGAVQNIVDGSLYKVDLPDEKIARMLDWDKPLSQQAPEVQKLAQQAGVFGPDGEVGGVLGKGLYESLGDGKASPATAEKLRRLGIPGIRYLDGGSRGVGAGTSNYVVFPGEEEALKILERNGQALGLLGK